MEKNKTSEVINGKAFIKPQISIQQCKNILNKNEQKYTDEEIVEIRNNLLILVEIDYYHFLRCMKMEQETQMQNEQVEKEVKVIAMQKNENDGNTEHFRIAS